MLELKVFRKLKKEPHSEYRATDQLSVFDLKRMYSIYAKYYANTRYEIFERDFLEKTGVFLVREPKNNQIVGFSTVTERDFLVDGKAHHAFFSGDTIIEQEYWGSRALQRAMYRYIIKFKLRHPTKPVYWLLISKGFKTYLLLANNYYTYFPHYNNKHENLEKYVHAYCQQYFAEYYEKETGLLNFGQDYQPLKEDIAPITEEMRQKNQKIAYFEKCNPEWVKGKELPCIGELTWLDLSRYVQRFFTKKSSKGTLDQNSTSASKTKLNIVKPSKVA